MIKCVECNKELKAIQTSHFRGSCSSNLKSLAEYKLKHPTAPIRCAETRKKMGHSLQSFVSRYGEIEGMARWDAYRKKLSDKNSLEFFLKKGKTVKDWEEYNSSRAVTLENLIAKYGEMEGSQRFKSYCDKQRKAGNTLEYFVEKYGIEEGSEKYSSVCKSKGITLENMIRVHGRDKGFTQYNKWLEKTKGNFVSLVASQFIKDIVEILPSNYIFHEGIFGKEFCIWDGASVKMFDFVITSPVKKVIEFNGDFWHANPDKFSKDDIIPLRGGAVSAEEIWKRDEKKIQEIKSRGFDVRIVWESEYRANPQQVISEAIAWIMS